MASPKPSPLDPIAEAQREAATVRRHYLHVRGLLKTLVQQVEHDFECSRPTTCADTRRLLVATAKDYLNKRRRWKR